MRINIDIEQSIKNKRLKAIKRGFFQKFDGFVYVLYSLILISIGLIFPVFMTIQGIQEGRGDLIMPLVIFSPFIIIGLLTVYALINDNQLRTFEGVDEESNRRVLLQILENRFRVSINQDGGKTMRIYKKATLWKWGLRVIVIFHDQYVSISIARFNFQELKSPFHPWFDDLKIKSIINEFNKTINNDV